MIGDLFSTQNCFVNSPRIFIVDGTGNGDDKKYKEDMQFGFCRQIEAENSNTSLYLRGPDAASLNAYSVSANANRILSIIEESTKRSGKSGICLIGYSRGGATVVKIAQEIQSRGLQGKVEVDAMFLFDAVQRAPGAGDQTEVPSNVKVCFHAMRNDGAYWILKAEVENAWALVTKSSEYAELVKEYKRVGSGFFETFLLSRSKTKYPALNTAVTGYLKKNTVLDRYEMTMRNSWTVVKNEKGETEPGLPFGNCATGGSMLKTEQFAGSHAALGGCVWRTLGPEIAKLDEECKSRVKTWMWPNLMRHGISVGARK